MQYFILTPSGAVIAATEAYWSRWWRESSPAPSALLFGPLTIFIGFRGAVSDSDGIAGVMVASVVLGRGYESKALWSCRFPHGDPVAAMRAQNKAIMVVGGLLGTVNRRIAKENRT